MQKARVVLLLSALPLAVALVGCSSPSPEPTATSDTSTPSASASAAPTAKDLSGVKVTGDFGTAPTVTFSKPFNLGETKTDVLKKGTGRTVSAGSIVQVNYHGVNGRDGVVFDDSYSRGEPANFSIEQVIPGFKKGLEGQTVGSRVLIGVTGQDGYDSSGGSQDGQIQVGDTLLFVVDILDTSYTMASGAAVAPKAGLPTVTFSDNKPTITIPDSDPPKTLQVQPLITGAGAKVTANDTIQVKYTGVSWTTKQVVEEDWAMGEAADLSGLIKGWQQGLVGQTVGSRVLLVVPPDLAYPEGRRAPKIEPGDTLVYVLDILHASTPAE